jgi:hypothetical protein
VSGTLLTTEFAKQQNKPYQINPAVVPLSEWLQGNNIRILNVAGNRGSKITPKQMEQIRITLTQALQAVSQI